MSDALVINGANLTGDATIEVKRKYNAIVIENVKGDLNGDFITIDNEDNSVMILQNCDLTLAEGKKLIKSTKTIYQVFMANITINGVKLTNANAAQYLENVGWFQVVEEI
jgi:FlaG/FlaF family flagellin (archaellin)